MKLIFDFLCLFAKALEDDIQLDEELRKRNIFRRQVATTASPSSTSSSSAPSAPSSSAPSTCVSRPSTAAGRSPRIDIADFCPEPSHDDDQDVMEAADRALDLADVAVQEAAAAVVEAYSSREVGTAIGSSMDMQSPPGKIIRQYFCS